MKKNILFYIENMSDNAAFKQAKPLSKVQLK